jgi:cathepsin C
MVYDEGFNIEFGLYSFFAFSKYTITEDNGIKTLQSLCYSTLTGWYTSNDKLLRGCYRATKLGVDPSYVSWSVTKQNNMNVIPLALNTLAQYYPSFLETSQKVKKINLHEEYVQKLNSIKKSWTAGIYPEFKSKSVQQLNKFAGLFRFKSLDKKQFIKKNTRIYNNEFMRKLNPFRNSIKIVSNEERRIILPKNFDWKHLLKTSINQKNCGSCYVIATMQMLEARLKILYNHDVSLSVQHVLNCSFYNQGCNGGYPFLVMKFGNEFELLPETCQPYVVR